MLRVIGAWYVLHIRGLLHHSLTISPTAQRSMLHSRGPLANVYFPSPVLPPLTESLPRIRVASALVYRVECSCVQYRAPQLSLQERNRQERRQFNRQVSKTEKHFALHVPRKAFDQHGHAP